MATLPSNDFRMTDEELRTYNNACPKTGSYYARIFKFVHRGTKKEKFVKTNEEKDVNKFKMYFEILSHPSFVFDEKKGLQPWTANVESSYSTSDRSNLLKYIKQIYKNDPAIIDSVTGGKFQISKLMNVLVMIDTTQTISTKTGKANIKVTNVTAPLEMPDIPEMVQKVQQYRTQPLYNEFVMFDIDDFIAKNPADVAAFGKLYKFEREDIAETFEWKKAGLRLEDFQVAQQRAPEYAYQANAQTGFSNQPAAQGNLPDDMPIEDELPF
jgi:hypothetical protein